MPKRVPDLEWPEFMLRKEWAELDAEEQAAAHVLGWRHALAWNTAQYVPAVSRSFVSLSWEQQQAARKLGLSEEAWWGDRNLVRKPHGALPCWDRRRRLQAWAPLPTTEEGERFDRRRSLAHSDSDADGFGLRPPPEGEGEERGISHELPRARLSIKAVDVKLDDWERDSRGTFQEVCVVRSHGRQWSCTESEAEVLQAQASCRMDRWRDENWRDENVTSGFVCTNNMLQRGGLCAQSLRCRVTLPPG